MCEDAVSDARARDHPFTLAFTLMHVAAVHETRRDARAARVHAAEATDIAREHNLGLMLAWATGFLGWSMAELGEASQGLPILADAVAAARATGSALFQPHLLGLLAHVQTTSGLLSEAQQTLDAAFTVSDQTGERFYVAELHRLKGELRLAGADVSASWSLAEHDFRTAIRLAQDQGAHQLALRAAVSLARLFTHTGRASELMGLLLDVRGSVAEGRTLPDMLDAEAIVNSEPGRQLRPRHRHQSGRA